MTPPHHSSSLSQTNRPALLRELLQRDYDRASEAAGCAIGQDGGDHFAWIPISVSHSFFLLVSTSLAHSLVSLSPYLQPCMHASLTRSLSLSLSFFILAGIFVGDTGWPSPTDPFPSKFEPPQAFPFLIIECLKKLNISRTAKGVYSGVYCRRMISSKMKPPFLS